MTDQEKDRIECAIRHIQTAVDVDPWAKEIAVEAMEKQIPKNSNESSLTQKGLDTISRQAAIDAIVDCTVYGNADDLKEAVMQENAWNKWSGGVLEALEAVEELPSAQPEIVRCKDCEHRDPEDKKCDCGHAILWQLPRQDDWYCADAERRTDD